ncbi:hypothetical protein NDQ71_00495 [Pseudoalteromonas sp. KG3]|uniref:hypothetical protein n=1 Tax=Pseudoalteromonas sp. KG3 TaxID=2951137 RepID=UPI00265AB6AF|nr:hypothetical protein [Pseudoalteromonas sp. KG3]WKD23626.1 hypothetical protein NDQ71_00495 [Pseudoalteromonas sp. KG3]
MDSVIKKSGLLGWPNSTYPLGNEFIFETSMASYAKAPNEYNAGESIKINGYTATYYNTDGSIKWTTSTVDFGRYTLAFKSGMPIVFFTETHVYALIRHASNDPSVWFVRFAVSDGIAELSTTRTLVSNNLVFTEHNNDIILIGEAEGGTQHAAKAYRLNTGTFSFVEEPLNTFSIKEFSQTYSYRGGAAALFNGAVVIKRSGLDSGTYNSHDALSVVFGLNDNLLLSDISAKERVETSHDLSIDAFNGDVQQISKNLFYCGAFTIAGRYQIAPVFRPKFYTRAELERWASDCIYKTTGFKIPLSEGV